MDRLVVILGTLGLFLGARKPRGNARPVIFNHHLGGRRGLLLRSFDICRLTRGIELRHLLVKIPLDGGTLSRRGGTRCRQRSLGGISLRRDLLLKSSGSFGGFRSESGRGVLAKRLHLLIARLADRLVFHLYEILGDVEHRGGSWHGLSGNRRDCRLRLSKASFCRTRRCLRRLVNHGGSVGDHASDASRFLSMDYRVLFIVLNSRRRAANTSSGLHEHSNTRCIAIGTSAISSCTVREREDSRSNRNNRGNHRDDRDNDNGSTRRITESQPANEKQNRSNHSSNRCTKLDYRKNPQKRLVQLSLNLTAVVMGNNHYLSMGRLHVGGGGLVLRHYILTHAFAEHAREDWLAKRFSEHKTPAYQSKEECENPNSGNRKTQNHCNEHDACTNERRRLRVGGYGEVLDFCCEARFLLKIVGDIERRLLLLFGTARSRPDFLGEI